MPSEFGPTFDHAQRIHDDREPPEDLGADDYLGDYFPRDDWHDGHPKQPIQNECHGCHEIFEATEELNFCINCACEIARGELGNALWEATFGHNTERSHGGDTKA